MINYIIELFRDVIGVLVREYKIYLSVNGFKIWNDWVNIGCCDVKDMKKLSIVGVEGVMILFIVI